MSDDDAGDQAAAWKRKYFDVLEQHEARERRWSQADDLLRRALSRLTLAADGLDADLDHQLQALRDAIRDRADEAALRQRVEAMSASLVRLDGRPPRKRAAPGPAAVLLALLDAVALPRGQARRAKALRRRLADVPAGAADDILVGAIAEFAALLRDALAGTSPAGPPPGTRLLGRLLGRPDHGRPAEAAVSAPVSAAELLLQLLERLDLPEDLAPQVEAIKEQLENRASFDAQQVLRDMVDVIGAVRCRVQRERGDIELFLKQLNARLQDIDAQVRGAQATRVESYASGRSFGDAVQAQVRDIGARVAGADDLDHLKRDIHGRMEALIDRMDQHRRDEERRQAQAEAQTASLNERLRDMEAETARLRDRVLQERAQALTDTLTGIPNRLAYEERITAEFARWKRFGTPLALLVWDVDRFKDINDEYGHKAGDKVLRVIAGLLADGVRETDFVARLGGEEFVMVTTGAAGGAVFEVADKLRLAVSHCGFHFRGDSVPVTISCGIAEFRGGDSVDAVFERADRALYRAKREGRNRCVDAGGSG